jgi:hypothetical protein
MPRLPLEADLNALFSDQDFGVEGGAIRNGQAGNPIAGIFDEEDVQSQNGEGVEILVRRVTFTCSSSKVPALAEGDTFTINGDNYIARYWMQEDEIVEIYLEATDIAEVLAPEGDEIIVLDGGTP